VNRRPDQWFQLDTLPNPRNIAMKIEYGSYPEWLRVGPDDATATFPNWLDCNVFGFGANSCPVESGEDKKTRSTLNVKASSYRSRLFLFFGVAGE